MSHSVQQNSDLFAQTALLERLETGAKFGGKVFPANRKRIGKIVYGFVRKFSFWPKSNLADAFQASQTSRRTR